MDWLTHLYMYGEVTMTLDARYARPAFTSTPDKKD